MADIFDDVIAVRKAADRIRELLKDAQSRVEIKGSIMVHEYEPKPEKDYRGEADGEWRIDGIRGKDTKSLVQSMLEAMLPSDVLPGDRLSSLGKGYWITVGLRFHGKSVYDKKSRKWTLDPSEDHYKKFAGMLDVSSNYRKMERSAKILSAFIATIWPSSKKENPMFYNIEKKYKRKVSQVYVKINWNPEDVQPKRNEK